MSPLCERVKYQFNHVCLSISLSVAVCQKYNVLSSGCDLSQLNLTVLTQHSVGQNVGILFLQEFFIRVMALCSLTIWIIEGMGWQSL